MYVCTVFAVLHMKKACLLLLVPVLLLVLVQVPGAHAKLGNINNGTVVFELGDYPSGYVHVGDLVNQNEPTFVTGEIWMYNDTDTIYIAVLVWVKPYLAYGELETFHGSRILDLTKKDKNEDGTIDKYDLGSDGIVIKGLGDPYFTGDKKDGYRWFVDTAKNGSYLAKGDDPSDTKNYGKKRRDPEIDVPSWNANLSSGGILEGNIEYFAEIPFSDVVAALGGNPWEICIEVHASPKNPIPEHVIPEVPFGTIGAFVAFFAALGVTAIHKK